MTCHKVTYRTKLLAKIALARVQVDDHDSRRIYWCAEHRGYHLTSKR